MVWLCVCYVFHETACKIIHHPCGFRIKVVYTMWFPFNFIFHTAVDNFMVSDLVSCFSLGKVKHSFTDKLTVYKRASDTVPSAVD